MSSQMLCSFFQSSMKQSSRLLSAAKQLTKLGLGELLLISLFGFLLVFVVLLAIQAIISLTARSASWTSAKTSAASLSGETPPQTVPLSVPNVASSPRQMAAKGSLGEIELNDVDPQTAALLIAIVAEQMETPLNQLRFISVRECK